MFAKHEFIAARKQIEGEAGRIFRDPGSKERVLGLIGDLIERIDDLERALGVELDDPSIRYQIISGALAGIGRAFVVQLGRENVREWQPTRAQAAEEAIATADEVLRQLRPAGQ